MKRIAMTAALAVAGLLALGSAWGRASDVTDPNLPHSLPYEGPVSVSWTDPAQFREIRYSGNRYEAKRGDWVRDLAKYLRKDVARQLPQGARMDVTITDVDRAGEYEPGLDRLHSARFMRDIYPPRIDLTFKLVGADGAVLAEGTRKLTDPGYLVNNMRLTDTDPLRYEKQLIDKWRRQEFKTAGL